jgi:hypothetical protein
VSAIQTWLLLAGVFAAGVVVGAWGFLIVTTYRSGAGDSYDESEK